MQDIQLLVRVHSLYSLALHDAHLHPGACHAWLARGGRGDTDDAAGASEEIIRQECGIGKLLLKSTSYQHVAFEFLLHAGIIEIRRCGRLLSFAAPKFLRHEPLPPCDLERICRGLSLSPHDIVASHWIDNGPGWRGILLKSDAQVRSLTVDSGRATLHPPANTFDWPATGFAPAPTRSYLSECACSCTWSYGLGCHCTLPRWGHIRIRSAPSRTQLYASCAHSPPGARLFPLCIRDNHRRPVHGLCSPASCTHAFEPRFYFNICFTDPLPSAAFVHPQSTGSLHAAFGVWLIGHPPSTLCPCAPWQAFDRIIFRCRVSAQQVHGKAGKRSPLSLLRFAFNAEIALAIRRRAIYSGFIRHRRLIKRSQGSQLQREGVVHVEQQVQRFSIEGCSSSHNIREIEFGLEESACKW